MVSVTIIRDEKDFIIGFKVGGHANTAPHGEDIVCAGISALTQSAVLGLQKYLQRNIYLKISDGNLVTELTDSPDELSQAILETMCLGLEEIHRLYPQNVKMLQHRR